MTSSKTMEILEETVDAIDETLDTLERIPKANLNGTTKGQQILILTFTAGVSAALGGFVAYKVTKEKLRKHYEDVAEEEIRQAKEYFAGEKAGVFADPQSAAAALIPEEEREPQQPVSTTKTATQLMEEAQEAVGEYAPDGTVLPQSEKDRLLAQESLKTPYHEMYKGDLSLDQADRIIEKDPDADPQEVTARVRFPATPAEADNFDMEKEAPLRSMERPYVITHDEFFEREREFENQSLTWFAGDSVLVDSDEEPIGDVEGMVGTSNMARFGHGSKDENLVYIRNERYEIDFEIALSHGTYTKDVLGLDPPE